MARLGAEFAVLRAVAAPRVQNGAEIDGAAAVFLADLIGHGEEEHGVLVFHADEPLRFFFCDLPAGDDLFRQRYDVSACIFHFFSSRLPAIVILQASIR